MFLKPVSAWMYQQTRKQKKINSCRGDTTMSEARETTTILSWRWWVLAVFKQLMPSSSLFLSPFKIQISLQDAEISILKYSWELSELALYTWGVEQVLYGTQAVFVKVSLALWSKQIHFNCFCQKEEHNAMELGSQVDGKFVLTVSE